MVTSVGHSGVPKCSLMTWDASGNRITFSSSTRANEADKYTFVYDITGSVPAVTEEIAPGGGTVTYIHEPSGGLLARVYLVGTAEYTLYYHFDELGSTIFLTDTNGVISDKYTYDAHGNVTSHSGSTQQPYQYVGAYGYYTHYQNQNLPYIQTCFRLYSPEMGRYIQEDRIKSKPNWYAYAECQPTLMIDPWGEEAAVLTPVPTPTPIPQPAYAFQSPWFAIVIGGYAFYDYTNWCLTGETGYLTGYGDHLGDLLGDWFYGRNIRRCESFTWGKSKERHEKGAARPGAKPHRRGAPNKKKPTKEKFPKKPRRNQDILEVQWTKNARLPYVY